MIFDTLFIKSKSAKSQLHSIYSRGRDACKILGFCSFFLISSIFFSSGELRAQFACQGAACSVLPLGQNNLNRILAEFQNQYTNVLFNDMAEASVVANLAGPPIGSVNLQGFTLGLSLAASAIKPHNVTVTIPGVGEFEDIPSAGGAINPRIFVGANLGQILGSTRDPFGENEKAPPWYSPDRFDIFISFMDVTETMPLNKQTRARVHASAYLRGAEVRYHLVRGGASLFGPVFRFMGVSIGTGIYNSRQNLEVSQDPSDMSVSLSGVEMIWQGTNLVRMRTKIDTYPTEIRTGVQVLHFIYITLGVGVANSKGYAEAELSRAGTIYGIVPDELKLLGVDIPTADLSMSIRGKGDVPARLSYMKPGIELNLPILKIGLEGIITKRAYGLNLAVRMEL